MYRFLYPGDIYAELDRAQREVQRLFGQTPSIRGIGRSGYPALNVGGTPSRWKSTPLPRPGSSQDRGECRARRAYPVRRAPA